MISTDPRALLGELPLFRDLPEGDLSDLLSNATVRRFGRHEVLFEEGSRIDLCHVVVSGWLKTLRRHADGHDLAVDIWSSATIPSLQCIVAGTAHAVTCVGMREGAVVSIARDRFDDALRNGGAAFPRGVAQALAATLLRQIELRSSLALASVPARIARLFLLLAKTEGARRDGALTIEVPLTRLEVAELVGSTVSTVIRIVREWDRGELLEMTQARVVIKDEDAMVAIAG